eukprot:8413543-Lingulodinium_polyedra.AAC.1
MLVWQHVAVPKHLNPLVCGKEKQEEREDGAFGQVRRVGETWVARIMFFKETAEPHRAKWRPSLQA